MRLLKNLMAVSCGTVIITKTQPTYAIVQAAATAKPNRGILSLFMNFLLMVYVVAHVPTHHQ
ncbi:hypothetical protein [Stieleria neptunia]|uniref:hypothetical protein n=1 Tax=Stieleria neptunia TaxID=2527979 RepID=UPI0018D203F6|nr:hypothetical protein [Stieleria neptunia]